MHIFLLIAAVAVATTVLRGTILNRTYGTHKGLPYWPFFTNNIWSYSLWSPVVAMSLLLLLLVLLMLLQLAAADGASNDAADTRLLFTSLFIVLVVLSLLLIGLTFSSSDDDDVGADCLLLLGEGLRPGAAAAATLSGPRLPHPPCLLLRGRRRMHVAHVLCMWPARELERERGGGGCFCFRTTAS